MDEIRQAARRAFNNLVELAISEKIDFIVIAGDLYDGDWKDFNTGLYFVSQTVKLRNAGIFVYIIFGNHDAASKITKSLRLPDNVHTFSSDKPETFLIENLNVAIHGQSFPSPSVKKICHFFIHHLFQVILILACSIRAFPGGRDMSPMPPCTLEGLRRLGYDYWALGHVHKKEILCDDPLILFPGNIQGRYIRETGHKGCMLVSVDSMGKPSFEFRSLDVIRWVNLDIDAKGAQTSDDILDRFFKHLGNLLNGNSGMPLVVRVMIEGETTAHWELFTDIEKWNNEIRGVALDISGEMVWIEKIQIRTHPPLSEQNLKKGEGAMGGTCGAF